VPTTTVREDISQYLQHLIDEGTRRIEVSPELAAELRRAGPASLNRQRPGKQQSDNRPTTQVSRSSVGSTAKSAAPTGPTAKELADIAGVIATCKKCDLHKTRTNTVPGQGCTDPDIMFIGEGPGEDEDLQGLAFVGRAGQLLTKMIEAMGYTRDQVFIANIVKCRPPNNRPPMPEEMDACLPYLKAQIALLKPKVIVGLGSTAVKGLLGVQTGITKLRGKWHSYEGIDFMPTFHPSYLLRYAPAKRDAWEDLQSVLERLGKEPPPRKQR
jgi:uracil-DNA glycosylase